MNYQQNPKNSIKRSITSSLYDMSSSWKHPTASCALIRQTQNNIDFLHSLNKIQDLSPSDIQEFCSSHRMPQRSESTPVIYSLKKFLDTNVPKILTLLDNSPETVMANSIRLKDASVCGSTSSLVEQIVSSGLSVHCPPARVDGIQCSSSKEKDKEDDSVKKVQLNTEQVNKDAVVKSLDSKHAVVSEEEMEVDEDIVFTSSSGDEEEDDDDEEDQEEDSDEDMTDEEEDDDDDDDWDIGDDRYVGKESLGSNENVNESTTVAYFVSNSLSMDWNSGIEEEINNLSIINNSPGLQLDSDDDDFESLLICEANKKWESFYSTAAVETEAKSRQVSFACEESLVTLHCWEDMEDSRKGLWNIDAQRFRRRIYECGKVLSQILQTDHRKKMFSSLHHFKE